jgi:hypothetical protein
MKLTEALTLFVVILAATILGNLIVAKIISDQVQSTASQTPLGKLLGVP